ncbi:MAG: DUF5993 family protein [Candidatus Dasytiphilus stammeri]
MYLPFVISFLTVICFLLKKVKYGYILWTILSIVTIACFKYHATRALNLSF